MDTFSARAAAAGFPLAPLVAVTVTKGAAGYVPLIWSPTDCVRLRGEGGVAISPVGLCPTKVSTNAKAAAVPAALSDEELYLTHSLGWLACTDAATGAPFDAAVALEHAITSARDDEHRRRIRLKRAAFADLWVRGYRMTAGLKFGVDYLAYRADPSVCHAAFMVRVLPAGSDVTPLDLVARARVATTTLKTAVLAYVQLPPPGSGSGEGTAAAPEVRYEAFKRMGPGHAVFAAASAMTVPLLPPPPQGALPWEQGIGLSEEGPPDGAPGAGEGPEGLEPADTAALDVVVDTGAAGSDGAEPAGKRQRLDGAPTDSQG